MARSQSCVKRYLPLLLACVYRLIPKPADRVYFSLHPRAHSPLPRLGLGANTSTAPRVSVGPQARTPLQVYSALRPRSHIPPCVDSHPAVTTAGYTVGYLSRWSHEPW